MRLSHPTIQNRFPNPVFFYRINLINNQHQDLINECIEWSKSSKGVNISNAGGWHSETNLFQRNEPNLKNLTHLIVDAANQSVVNISPKFPLEKYNLFSEGWVNINSKFDFNYPHFHAGFNLSGVYYLKIPQGNQKNSGLIQFLDPRGSVEHFAQGVPELLKPFENQFSIVPHENLLIIFPSWLQHFVTPNLEDEDRISMAFNFIYKRKE